MYQPDDNSLMALLMKRDQVRFREIVNTCTERRAEKRIQQTVWILRHVLRTTLCEHVNGLSPAGWLNEQSITKHWFQSVRTCPYSWATGRNSISCSWGFDTAVCLFRWNSNSYYGHRVTFGTVITTKFLVTSNQSTIFFWKFSYCIVFQQYGRDDAASVWSPGDRVVTVHLSDVDVASVPSAGDTIFTVDLSVTDVASVLFIKDGCISSVAISLDHFTFWKKHTWATWI